MEITSKSKDDIKIFENNNESMNHKYNIVARIITTFTLAILMFLLSKFIIVWYGDDINGLTRSMLQIISYFMLFDAGIESVFLNKIVSPLKEGNKKEVNIILTQYRKVMILVGLIYSILVIIFSTLYSFIVKSNELLTFGFTMQLVLILGFTSGIIYFTYGKRDFLLYVLHKNYIRNLISVFIKAMVFIFAILALYFLKPRLVKVTNGSVITFTIAPQDLYKKNYILLVFAIIALEKVIYGIYTWNYFRINYSWVNYKHKDAKIKKNEIVKALTTGIGLKIGALILFSTDEIVLTLLSHKSNAVYALSLVSIYAMYSSIINIIRRLLTQLLYTNKVKISRTQKDYDAATKELHFKTHVLALMALGVSFIFTPIFVKYFFSSPGSTGYWNIPLSTMMSVYSYLFILRTPILIRWELKGKFKTIIILTIIEAIINLGLSFALVWSMNILGVIIATLIGGIIFLFISERQQFKEKYGSIFNCGSKYKNIIVIVFTALIFTIMIIFTILLRDENIIMSLFASGTHGGFTTMFIILNIMLILSLPTVIIFQLYIFPKIKKTKVWNNYFR